MWDNVHMGKDFPTILRISYSWPENLKRLSHNGFKMNILKDEFNKNEVVFSILEDYLKYNYNPL